MDKIKEAENKTMLGIQKGHDQEIKEIHEEMNHSVNFNSDHKTMLGYILDCNLSKLGLLLCLHPIVQSLLHKEQILYLLTVISTCMSIVRLSE